MSSGDTTHQKFISDPVEEMKSVGNNVSLKGCSEKEKVNSKQNQTAEKASFTTSLEEPPRRWNRQTQQSWSKENSSYRHNLRKEDIGHPENFVCLQHVSYDERKGFSYPKKEVIEANIEKFFTSTGAGRVDKYICDRKKLLTGTFAEAAILEDVDKQSHNATKSGATPSKFTFRPVLKKWQSVPVLETESANERVTKGNKKLQISKEDIGQPSNFRHVLHVGTSDPFKQCIDLEGCKVNVLDAFDVEKENIPLTSTNVNVQIEHNTSGTDKTDISSCCTDDQFIASCESYSLQPPKPAPRRRRAAPPPPLPGKFQSCHSYDALIQENDEDHAISSQLSPDAASFSPSCSPVDYLPSSAHMNFSFKSSASILSSETETLGSESEHCDTNFQQTQMSFAQRDYLLITVSESEVPPQIFKPLLRKSLLKVKQDDPLESTKIKEETSKDAEELESVNQEYIPPWFGVIESPDIQEL